MEDWHGARDAKYRGTGGQVFVQPAHDPNPLAPATVEGARSVGIPTFENQNGRMMEGDGGASISDVRARNGKRQSVFRSYSFPLMDHASQVWVRIFKTMLLLTVSGNIRRYCHRATPCPRQSSSGRASPDFVCLPG